MSVIAPRTATGIGAATARVASRFYYFGILLVASTYFLPSKTPPHTAGLLVLACLAGGTIAFLALFPWDNHSMRVFTIVHLTASCVLTSLLIYFTGGSRSSYSLLFFLIIFFSYFYNLREMFAITTVVSLFYLLPYLYESPDPSSFGMSAVTVVFFYLGTYFLFGVTRFIVRKNETLVELNRRVSELSSVADAVLHDLESGSLDQLAENLKRHIPSTYCIVLLADKEMNLVRRMACPIRSLDGDLSPGAVYAPDRLMSVRRVFETRQPVLYQIDDDEMDDDIRSLITDKTSTVLVVPIRIGSENGGVMIFGEERHWNRAPFTHEKIQLSVAVSKQVAVGVQMWRCRERLDVARTQLEQSRDAVVKAERLAALGEVTRTVEHGINNPLSVIVNWCEVYRDDAAVDAEVRKKFQIIYDMAIRISDVVRKLSEHRESKSIEFLKGQRMMKLR